jgi:hypothetical protein
MLFRHCVRVTCVQLTPSGSIPLPSSKFISHVTYVMFQPHHINSISRWVHLPVTFGSDLWYVLSAIMTEVA